MIELSKDSIISNIIQEIKDIIYGGITPRNMKSIRTAFVLCSQDSLDGDYPFHIPFIVPASTIRIVQVRLSFFILPFRAYSKTAKSGGGSTVTSASGGEWTITSASGGGYSSGNTSTSQSSHGVYAVYNIACTWHSNPNGWLITDSGNMTPVIEKTNVAPYGHYHTFSITIPDHYHYVVVPPHNHSVTIPDHQHDIEFGIYEYKGSPTITVSVSKDNGGLYTPLGSYTQNQIGLEITSLTDHRSVNIIRFESTSLTRISAQVEVKVDISR